MASKTNIVVDDPATLTRIVNVPGLFGAGVTGVTVV
jgi:hypothetical protein